MKELDFDIFKGQDAGRTFYRGLFIFTGLYLFKNYTVKTELWKGSNCFIQMRPRLRYFYVSMIAAFTPYITKLLYEKYYQNDDFKLFYTHNSMLGMINGSLIAYLTLSSQPTFMLIELSSPRINPKFVDKQNLKQDDNNVLFLEQQESERRLQRLKQMLETKEFKEGKQIQFSPTSASPQQQLKINAFKEQIVIDGKEVSQELIYNLIGKRFHSCLNESSKNLKPYQDLSNKELIHQVSHQLRIFSTQNQNTEPQPKVPQTLYEKIEPYMRLARLEKQIGTQLLLLPCYWGLALGSPTVIPSLKMISLFTVGALATRSAGCIINDFLDRDIDKHVERTKARPLTTGEITPVQAGIFLSGLMALNFSILFSLPWECIKYGLMVTPVVFLYPMTKRFFKVPQLILGITFNSGVFIGYAAVAVNLAADLSVCLPFYFGGILWTIVYDTIYAFQDRKFDKKLGLNSAAITFENYPKEILTTLCTASVGLFLLGGMNAGLGAPYFAGLAGVAAHYTWQMYTLDINNPQKCWNLFTANRYLGLILMLSIMLGKATQNKEENNQSNELSKEGEIKQMQA
eukprot:403348171